MLDKKYVSFIIEGLKKVKLAFPSVEAIDTE